MNSAVFHNTHLLLHSILTICSHEKTNEFKAESSNGEDATATFMNQNRDMFAMVRECSYRVRAMQSQMLIDNIISFVLSGTSIMISYITL